MIEDTIDKPRAPTFLFLSCVMIVISFMLFTSPLLNMYVRYSTPGGSFFEKFHPATYLIFLTFSLTVLKGGRRPADQRSDTVVPYLVTFSALALYALLIDNPGYFSILIDIFVAPVMFVMILQRIDDKSLETLFRLFVTLTVLHTLIITLEFATRTAILPYAQSYAFFRPAGLLGHPIAAGAVCCMAMIGSQYVITSYMIRRFAMLTLLLQIAMCGVRAPLAVGAVIFLADVLRPYNQKRTSMNVVFDYAIIILVALGAITLAQLGVFDRIMSVGVWDDSADSRFEIFRIFDFMSDEEFWYGTSYERAFYYASVINYKGIESSFVVSVYQCGIVFACALFATILLYFTSTIRNSYLFAILLAFIALTTIFFGVKGTVTFPLFFLSHLIVRTARRDGVQRRAEHTPVAQPPYMAGAIRAT